MRLARFCTIHLYAGILLAGISTTVFGQSETVPVNHTVYLFLKRMEVKGLIERYHDAILPVSRKQVGGFLNTVDGLRDKLTPSEQGYLDDYLSEFRFDIGGSLEGFHSLIAPENTEVTSGFAGLISPREKYLYAYADSNLSFFVNGLLTFDARRISGDALGSERAEFVQFGGRIRGTVFGKLGYYLQGTNAQFWGRREFLMLDRQINQAYTLQVGDARNFDFSEGYARYDADVVSVQVGRERLLWGYGFEQKMIMSDNVRVFDFIRLDAQYKSLKYTFMHGWLLGRKSNLLFTLPSDTSAVFSEPVVADKYVAAHRLEFSFPRVVDIGFQEIMIYSNRSVDLAFLNPFIVLESAQRSREERDNAMWAFDLQTHFIPHMQLHGTLFFDDIHFGEIFSDKWFNRWAFQGGVMYADPFTIPNTTLMVEYTRIEPWLFSHHRSRDNDYGSLGQTLGPSIGPNADQWFFRLDVFPSRNLLGSVRVSFERKGRNIVDASGQLIRNVGSDILQPHRDSDPLTKVFLDGELVKTRRLQLHMSYEFLHQMWAELMYMFERVKEASRPSAQNDHTGVVRLRFEL